MMKLNFDVTLDSLPCPVCHKKIIVKIHIEDKRKYVRGATLDEAFPYLPEEIRERFKTGLCSNTCWDKYLGL